MKVDITYIDGETETFHADDYSETDHSYAFAWKDRRNVIYKRRHIPREYVRVLTVEYGGTHE